MRRTNVKIKDKRKIMYIIGLAGFIGPHILYGIVAIVYSVGKGC